MVSALVEPHSLLLVLRYVQPRTPTRPKTLELLHILRDDGLSYGDYVDPVKRDKANLDIFWLEEDALEESAYLPPPEIIAHEVTGRP